MHALREALGVLVATQAPVGQGGGPRAERDDLPASPFSLAGQDHQELLRRPKPHGSAKAFLPRAGAEPFGLEDAAPLQELVGQAPLQPLAVGRFPSGPAREAAGRLILAATRLRGVVAPDRPAQIIVAVGAIGPPLALQMALAPANRCVVPHDLGGKRLKARRGLAHHSDEDGPRSKPSKPCTAVP